VSVKAREDHDDGFVTSGSDGLLLWLGQARDLGCGRDREAERAKIYEAAKAKRDTLAEDIRTIYPKAAATIAALLARIAAADRKVAAANEQLPAATPWLEPVEIVVRGRAPHEGSALSRSVRLPALLDKDTFWNLFWPVNQG
jgi:hypothetical protein